MAISVSPVKDLQGRITGAATIVRDITERKRTEHELQRRQEEIEALNERLRRAMQETHHRVKNNLQIVTAMLDLQTIEHTSEAMVPLKEIERLGLHIRTLAAVHDLLTKSVREDEHEQRVSSAVVIGQLLGLLEMTSGYHAIQSHVDDVQLLSKHAVTLSLAVNELVSNAVKHAAGRIEVTFRAAGEMAEMTVCDDGAGFPDGFDPAVDSHLGLELVQGLTQTDLRGRTVFENREEGGARVRILFPLAATHTDGSHEAPSLER